MIINDIINKIIKVSKYGEVHILLELNNDFSLLVEGSFSIDKNNKEILHSKEYIDSNFSSDILRNIKHLLENKNIISANIHKETGEIIFELENQFRFQSFYKESDYESWELREQEKTIYSSEAGTIITY